MNRSKLLIAVVMAVIAVIGYYAKMQTNPITGEQQHISLTPQQEVALGLQSAPSMAQQFGGLYPDQRLQTLVKQIGQKLVTNTEVAKSEYQYDFHLLADPNTINAFALPGGQIFITYGLLKQLKTEDEIAGVLGHEIGHVIGRHSAEHMAQQELTQGLVNAASVATDGGGGQMAAFVANMVNMKYGREDELESDKFGVKYMLQTGYNPEALIGVMEVLKAAGGGGQSEFTSSHPSPDNRISEIKRHIAEFSKLRNGSSPQ